MISYNPLWKTLIDRNMNKGDLKDKVGISFGTLAKMGKNEPVNQKVIDAICQELHCNVEDVLEIHHEGEL